MTSETTSYSSRALLIGAMTVTSAVAIWGGVDPNGLAEIARTIVGEMFRSRGWFVMLTVSTLLFVCAWLAISSTGRIRLGRNTDEPEFSTGAWISMLFAAGMGVGLLFYGTAEPISHFNAVRKVFPEPEAGMVALAVTNFHWGLHAWAIYASVGLVIAYFSFRRGTPTLLSAPFAAVFPGEAWAKVIGWLADFLAIIAIAIGLGGSIAMGVFQIRDGISVMTGLNPSATLALSLLFLLIMAYVPALIVDLDKGMAKLSKAAMMIAGALIVFVVVTGPTSFLMGTTLSATGEYLSLAIPQGFRTFALYKGMQGWFQDWTLTYMVWWLAWAPFVGVFIARISKGRTIREFVSVVIIVPTLFSVLWFGVFGGIGFFEIINGEGLIIEVVTRAIGETTFVVLSNLPLSSLTQAGTIIAAFLFVITSVVSAAVVLSMFSTGGNQTPPARIKLIWGLILGALGLVMILSDSIEAVRSLIALGAMPFVFIAVLLVICLIRALREEVA